MHFFMTTTIKTLCHDPKDWHMWESELPRIAFQNEYLLEVILAMACLHRGSLQPLNKSYWIRSAIQYQSQALPIFHSVLYNVNEDTCHAAFAL
jgi:hypothetical protein